MIIVNIIYIISLIIEATILWLYAAKLFLPKHSVIRRAVVLSTSYFIVFLLVLFEIPGLNAILFFLGTYFFLFTQFDLKWYTALFHSAIFSSLMAITELIAYGIISYFSPNFFSGPNYLQNMILHAVLSRTLLFFTTHLLTHLFKKSSNTTNAQEISSLFLGIIPITSIFVMLTFIVTDTAHSTPSLKWMVTVSAFFLLLVNLLVFGINQYTLKKQQEYTELQLQLQKESDLTEYYKMLLDQTENRNILIHDIKKHLQSIETLNIQGSQEKVTQYIQQLRCSSQLQQFSQVCDNILLNSILSRYSYRCQNLNKSLFIDIRSGSIPQMDDADITSLFCNLLDNALEAPTTQNAPFIDLHISIKENTPFTVISLINSCDKNPYNSITKTLTTQKSNKYSHGFGLKSIEKIVKKYHGEIQMYYDESAKTFHSIISIQQGNS